MYGESPKQTLLEWKDHQSCSCTGHTHDDDDCDDNDDDAYNLKVKKSADFTFQSKKHLRKKWVNCDDNIL